MGGGVRNVPDVIRAAPLLLICSSFSFLLHSYPFIICCSNKEGKGRETGCSDHRAEEGGFSKETREALVLEKLRGE